MDTKLCLLLLLSANLFAGKIFIYFSFKSFDYTFVFYVCAIYIFPYFNNYTYLPDFFLFFILLLFLFVLLGFFLTQISKESF